MNALETTTGPHTFNDQSHLPPSLRNAGPPDDGPALHGLGQNPWLQLGTVGLMSRSDVRTKPANVLRGT